MQDEDVQTVVNELSAWMCEARTEMGMTQSRVAGMLGKSFYAVKRFDADCGSASIQTFLGYLKTIGQLEMFRVHIPADHEHQFRFNVNTISGPM